LQVKARYAVCMPRGERTEVQAKLEQMARDAGRQPSEVIEGAVIGLYDELAYAR